MNDFTKLLRKVFSFVVASLLFLLSYFFATQVGEIVPPEFIDIWYSGASVSTGIFGFICIIAGVINFELD